VPCPYGHELLLTVLIAGPHVDGSGMLPGLYALTED
jgi:hypothetical protein